MNSSTINLINKFKDLCILVIGEAMLDSYLKGQSDRLCREAPVPVVTIQEQVHMPGGGANTAVNVRSLGAKVRFLSVVGHDLSAELLAGALKRYGVSTEDLIFDPTRTTLSKQRVVSTNQLVVRVDQGSTHNLEAQSEPQLISRLHDLYRICDAVVLSDYGYGILTPNVRHELKELILADPRILLVDAKNLSRYANLAVTAVKPNYAEAVSLLSLKRLPLAPDFELEAGECAEEARICQISEHSSRLLELTGAQIAAVTLDQSGALIFERGSAPYRTYARPQPNSRAAGAGDTFISAFALALAAGAHTENAAEIASAAASIVVGRDETAACYAEELEAFFTKSEKLVDNVFQLAAAINTYRRQGRKIVFTNGCFDILHRGHITYLNRAKALGDVLVVGLNSDASVRRLKGSGRPINTLEDREQVMAALSCVDHIIAFDGDTPHDLIRIVKPDVFAKGGDYTRNTLPEAALVEELGGRVEILPYIEEQSTTHIIDRIREAQPNTARSSQ